MRKIFTLLSLLVIASMVLAACGGTATSAPQATEAPTEVAATAAPTEAPTTRTGGWLDEIVASVVAKDSAITQLQAGAIDVYAAGLSSADLKSIQDAFDRFLSKLATIDPILFHKNFEL